MNQKLIATVLFIKDGQLLLFRDAIRPERLKPAGGKVEAGESFLQAAVREVQEELGIVLAPTDLQAIHLADFFWQDVHHVTAIFLAKQWAGELINKEPTEHSELVWVPLENLPLAMLAPLREAIKKGLAGEFYSEWRTAQSSLKTNF